MSSSEKTGTDTTATGSRRLEADLAARVDGEVRFDAGARGAYSTDGSNFRQVPIGVVLPRTVEAALAGVAVTLAGAAAAAARWARARVGPPAGR